MKMAMEAAISFMWETWRVTLFQIGVAMLGIIGMILYKKFIRRGQLAEEAFHEALLEEQSRREEVPQLHREPHEPEEHGLPHRYPQDEEPYPRDYDDMLVDEEPFNVFGVNAASRPAPSSFAPRPTSAQALHGDEELAEEDNLAEDDNDSMSVDAEQILDFGEHEDDFINLTEEEYDSYRTRLLVEVRGVEQYLIKLNRKVRREMEDLDPRNVFYGDIRSQMISGLREIMAMQRDVMNEGQATRARVIRFLHARHRYIHNHPPGDSDASMDQTSDPEGYAAVTYGWASDNTPSSCEEHAMEIAPTGASGAADGS